MKKLLFIALVIVTTTASSQNCKYKTNEIDKFTNKYTKITKSQTVFGTFFTQGNFCVKKIDTSFFFILDFVISSYSSFDPYSINKGAQLMFLLEDGGMVTLQSLDQINGDRRTIISLPPVYSCYLTNVSYGVTKDQINMFFKSKVKTIRFYRSEGNGKEDFIDNEVKSRNQDDIQNMIKCVM